MPRARLSGALVLALGLGLVAGGGLPPATAGSRDVVVEIAGDPGSDLAAILRNLGDQGVFKVTARRGNRLVVATDGPGYDVLLASPDLASVRLLRGDEASGIAAAGGSIEYTIRLGRTDGGDVALSALDGAFAASIEGKRESRGAARDSGRFVPGRLLVRGINAKGVVVANAVVTDPRLVRSEATGADGKTLTERRDFYRPAGTLVAALPADPAIVRIDILGTEDGKRRRLASLQLSR